MALGLALLLGLIQGLTEFFPVSSSGHLALFGHWFGLKEPDLVFDILLHVATLFAIIVYFRDDIRHMILSVFRRSPSSDLPPHIVYYLLAASVPAGIIGIFFKDHIEALHAQPQWVAVFLWITGGTLLLGLGIKTEGRPYAAIGWITVLLMGVAQAFAILPGISRSGATIMIGIFLGLNREAAARFSFLMALPAIGGAACLAVLEVMKQGDIARLFSTPFLTGFLAALIAGFFALVFLMRLLKGQRFFLFGFYCLGLGLLALILG